MFEHFTCTHIKTGKKYVILGTAIDTTDSEFDKKMIVYKNADQKVFVREMNEFFEKFEVDNDIKEGLKSL